MLDTVCSMTVHNVFYVFIYLKIYIPGSPLILSRSACRKAGGRPVLLSTSDQL